MEWPFVTIPDYGVRATQVEHLSGIDLLGFAPVVPYHLKEAWEEYAWAHQDWLHAGAAVVEEGHGTVGNITPTIFPYSKQALTQLSDLYYDRDALHHHHAADGSHDRALQWKQDFHVPFWQMEPIPTNASIANLDLYTHLSFIRMINEAMEVENALFSGIKSLDFIDSFIHFADAHKNFESRKVSFVLQPIFDKLDGDDRVIVAFLFGEIDWKSIFSNVLPQGTEGIVVHVQSSANDEFSFLIEGEHAEFLGDGHFHEHKYENMAHRAHFAAFARHQNTGDNGLDKGTSGDFLFNIYPTSGLEDPYHTNMPYLFTGGVVLAFCSTILVFAGYDLMVHRRQTKLLHTAERTTAIVSSLFPKAVQKRIMEEAEQQANEEAVGKRKLGLVAAKSRLKDFLHDEKDKAEPQDVIFTSKPIADLFPATTIMFADIVGFTAWSSMREPTQVFTLLETIYHSFDNLSKNRRVFKGMCCLLLF